MITTSNTVTHETLVTNLTKIGEVDGNSDVVEDAIVSISSTIGFAYSYTEQTVGIASSEDVAAGIATTEGVGFTTTVTITKNPVKSKNSSLSFSFNTAGIAATTFVGFSSLTESTVLGWISGTSIADKRTEHETELLAIKDKIINPTKHEKKKVDNMNGTLPWS